MSHHGKLREHKACENCGHFVESRYCPECGQENVETRQPFHYLFTVSIEDFVHYDSRFWKSIMYLLFYPARLTKIYLSGRRKLYVPPVTLYIFISFITFFIPSLLPEKGGGKQDAPQETAAAQAVSIAEDEKKIQEIKERLEQKYTKEDLNKLQDVVADLKERSKQIDRDDNNSLMADNFDNKSLFTQAEQEILKERILHDFPKAIFLYMPVFAFWLWLFHNKKKWYYFDHGIYTLHYFSFFLLSILVFILFHWVYSFFDMERFHWIKTIAAFITVAFIFYLIYYFFHSHHKVYQGTKARSRLLCTFLFFINTFCMLVFVALYLVVEMYFTKHTVLKEILNSIHNL